MTGTTERHTVRNSEDVKLEFYELMSATGSTDPAIRLQGTVVVQLSGTATDIVAIVERSSRDPGSAQVNWAPAEDDTFSGDLSAGIAPRAYTDPAIGFWRVRITTLTGGTCKVSIIGDRA